MLNRSAVGLPTILYSAALFPLNYLLSSSSPLALRFLPHHYPLGGTVFFCSRHLLLRCGFTISFFSLDLGFFILGYIIWFLYIIDGVLCRTAAGGGCGKGKEKKA
jgi:hypothetical protein